MYVLKYMPRKSLETLRNLAGCATSTHYTRQTTAQKVKNKQEPNDLKALVDSVTIQEM